MRWFKRLRDGWVASSLISFCCLFLPFSAEASGAWVCSTPCVQGFSGVGNGVATSETMTLTNVTAGHVIVMPSRGGINSSTVTVINDTGPATLTWTQIGSKTGPTDWVHTVHCAVAPATGTYTFHTTNNASGGTPSIRSLAIELNAGQCNGAETKVNTGSSYGSQAADPNVKSLVVTKASVLVAAVAIDSDLDHTGPLTATGGYTIRNPQCNQDVEPDQKLCAATLANISAAGTYSVDFGLAGDDSWNAWLIALPMSATNASRPTTPTGLKVQ